MKFERFDPIVSPFCDACAEMTVRTDVDKLIYDNYKLVPFLLNSKWNNTCIPKEDLVSGLILGLYKAARSYVPGTSKFTTYAVYIMNNEVHLLYRKMSSKLQSKVREVSLNEVAHEDDNSAIYFSDVIPDIAATADLDYIVTRNAVMDYLRKHKDDRAVKCWYMVNILGYNQRDVAAQVGVTQSYVSRLVTRTCTKLKRLCDL